MSNVAELLPGAAKHWDSRFPHGTKKELRGTTITG
jgi:hypothetical protein